MQSRLAGALKRSRYHATQDGGGGGAAHLALVSRDVCLPSPPSLSLPHPHTPNPTSPTLLGMRCQAIMPWCPPIGCPPSFFPPPTLPPVPLVAVVTIIKHCIVARRTHLSLDRRECVWLYATFCCVGRVPVDSGIIAFSYSPSWALQKGPGPGSTESCAFFGPLGALHFAIYSGGELRHYVGILVDSRDFKPILRRNTSVLTSPDDLRCFAYGALFEPLTICLFPAPPAPSPAAV